jgi:phosphomannomutase
VLDAARGREVQAIFESNRIRRAAWNELGQVESNAEALDWHRQRVRDLIPLDRIRARRFRVLLDANGGAGGPLGRRLLESLNCEVTPLGCNADGDFLHSPEPTADNLKLIAPLVVRHEADLGCALDPDSDRLALIDETGRYIGEELTLALAVRYRLEQERGPVVVNMSTSRVTEDIARKFDCPFHRSAVGEANVVQMMNQVEALIGGEGNGGVIDPRVGGVRDPFIGIGLILALLAETGRKLSELVAELPQYHIVKDKHPVDAAKLPELYDSLEKRWPEAKANRLDGLRLDWPDRWLHVRPSNTEPIVRVIAEAPTEDDARQLCAAVRR